MSGAEKARLGGFGTANPAAYEVYLKGRFLLERDTEEDDLEARKLFVRATELDPRFVDAYLLLSSTYAREALNNVQLEVATYADGHWYTSGALNLSGLCDSGGDALWIQAKTTRASWLQVGSSFTMLSPLPSFLPSAFPTTTDPSSGTVDMLMAPAHVPVITPVDQPEGDLPPTLRDQPLPPF